MIRIGFKIYFFITFFFLRVSLFGQSIDNTAVFRNIDSDKYFRFHYDNDFFSSTDFYYTQGINFELASPFLKKNPFSKLLLYSKTGYVRYGISIEHNVYTPTSIRHEEILYDDHPFAACLMLKSFCISNDTIRNSRLTAIFSAGVIGEAAFGEEMQKSIHRWLKNIEPLGWQNQVQNDVIINYEIHNEKLFYQYRNFLSINSNAEISAGTLNDKAKAGFTLQLGKFNSAFSSRAGNGQRNFQFYLYEQPLVSVVGYDATLQGGIFNSSSPYTLNKNQIERITFQNNIGLVLKLNKVYLEYFQSLITKEFSTGKLHHWGGVKFGISLK